MRKLLCALSVMTAALSYESNSFACDFFRSRRCRANVVYCDNSTQPKCETKTVAKNVMGLNLNPEEKSAVVEILSVFKESVETGKISSSDNKKLSKAIGDLIKEINQQQP